MLADAYAHAFWGFKCDGAKALKYLEMAERQNHLKTYHVRAGMYENGVGLPNDPKKMMECLEMGMKRGSRVCRELYAVRLIAGQGGDDRRAEGCAILQRILASGEAENAGYCLANLGFAYEHGYGVEKDIDKAAECYRQGIAHGNRYSQERLKALGRQ
jgi:TPR repeat protein